MKKRGSALIIALLLLAVVGGIAFSVGKLLFLESGTATLYQNGAVAYYAAESGIEEGFLRYRYNQNTEIPENSWTLTGNTVYRSSLSENSVTGTGSGIDKATAVSSAANQYYDLRMGYIGTDIGTANPKPWYGPSGTTDITQPQSYNTSASGDTYIAKDNSVKIDLSNIDWSDNANKLNLYGKFVNVTNVCDALVELKLTVQYSGENDVKQYTRLYSFNPTSCSSLGIASSKLGTLQFSSGNNFTVANNQILDDIIANAALAGAKPPNSGSKVSLTIKPVVKEDNSMNRGLVFGLSTNLCKNGNNCTDKTQIIAGPNTNITSDGYYGGVDKKLTANIDRQNGTLYDLYDYVIFTNSGN